MRALVNSLLVVINQPSVRICLLKTLAPCEVKLPLLPLMRYTGDFIGLGACPFKKAGLLNVYTETKIYRMCRGSDMANHCLGTVKDRQR